MKNAVKFILATALLASATVELHAQQASDGPAYRPFTLGLEGGLEGPGASVGYRFADHFGAHVGTDFVDAGVSEKIKEINYHANVQLLYTPLALDIYPWTSHSFHVSAGVVFNNLLLDGSASGRYTLNGNTYTGNVDLRIRQQMADPYLGIGGNLFYFDHAHHWAAPWQLGVMYTGEPRVDLNANTTAPSPTLASDVAKVRNEIKHDARFGEFWPVVTLGISYSF